MAIRTHPSYATAHENLGDIYAKMASQAYDKALQLDRSNQAAQTKLNLIKDLFSQGPRPTGKPVAVAKAETPAPAPAKAVEPPKPAPAPAPAAKAEKPEAPKPPAAVAKAEKAEPAKAAAPVRNNDEVLRAVSSWAHAWESNDVPGYLAHYAPDFQTPRGMSRASWEAERRTRIQKPRKIELDVQNPVVKFEGNNRAVVTFRQHYRSGSLNVTGPKTLVMVKNGDKWLIQQELSGS
jgi:ketosteroid isomerase-like protein